MVALNICNSWPLLLRADTCIDGDTHNFKLLADSLMKGQENRPGKKSVGKAPQRKGPHSEKTGREKEERPVRAASDREKTPSATENPSREETIKDWRKPVTNQDEQDKITNAGSGDIPLTEK